MIGAALGYPVNLCLPDSASHERKRILAAYGAELVITPGDEGTDGAIRRVREIVRRRSREIFLSRPVRQSRQLAGALSRHRQRNLGANQRPHHAFRRRTGHQRNVRGNDAPPQGIESEYPLHQPAAGRRIPRPRRLEAHGHRARAAIYDDGLADENLEVGTEEAYRMVKRWRAKKACL